MLAEQPSEFDVYLASERINERGIKVDLALAEAAIKRVEEEKSDLSAKISQLTNGRITSPTQGKRLRAELGPEIKKHQEAIDIITRIVTDRRAGGTKTTYSLDRQARSQLLDLGTSNPGYFSPYMMELLELMQAASNSSVKKFQTMKDRAGKDGRVRDSYICNGASQTGRFSARVLQLHNFSRTVPKDPENIRNALINGGQTDNVYATMDAMLRYALVAADGCSFVCADYSQIESRVLLYLCQAPQAALDVFRKMDANSESAIDNYVMAASSIFGKPPEEISKEQRNIGKVSVLACGFGGGARAFAAMARAFGISIPEDQARDIVTRWRSANPSVVGFWRDLEKAALDAILNEGTVYEAGEVSFFCTAKGLSPLFAAPIWANAQLPKAFC